MTQARATKARGRRILSRSRKTNPDDPVRMVELFSGIGAQASAMERAGIPHELVAVSEIDPRAYAVYRALHGDVPNLGDITKVERLPPDLDLVTYSFPCQDLSQAGRRRGMEKGSGTRSGLLWEVERLLREAERRGDLPQTLLMENVDQIVNRTNRPVFDEWVAFLDSLGYTSTWKVVNATDYGIPQNRKRCYMISTLDDRPFVFPEPSGSGAPMSSRLEDDSLVPDKYYVTDARLQSLEEHRRRQMERGNGFGYDPVDPGTRPARAITTKQREETGNLIVTGMLDIRGRDSTRRVYDPDGSSPTITTMQGGNTQPKIATDGGRSRVRRLTPRECWRLQDFSDEEYDRAAATEYGGRAMSDTQLYRQAGNSIPVGVMERLFRRQYLNENRRPRRR